MTKDEAKQRACLSAMNDCNPYDRRNVEYGFDAGYSAAQPQWKRISVDGLPEREGWYLVWMLWDAPALGQDPFAVTRKSFSLRIWFSKRDGFDLSEIDQKGANAVAWTPLPEYTGEV